MSENKGKTDQNSVSKEEIDDFAQALLDRKTEMALFKDMPKEEKTQDVSQRKQAERQLSSALDMLRKERGQLPIEEEERRYTFQQSLDDSNFEEVVLKSAQPVLVDFWAEWCGPCKMMLPIVEEISKEFEGKLVVAKVNVDEGSAAAKYGIRNIPTILFFKNGEVADKQVGAVPKTTLVSKINALL